jgi:hypothetical protein
MRHLALVAIALFIFTCNGRRTCGTAVTKLWSEVTGACYVIVETGWPAELIRVECDTAIFHSVVIGQKFCGKPLDIYHPNTAQ